MAEIKVSGFQPGQEALVSHIHNAGFDEWLEKLGRTYGYHKITPQDVREWRQSDTDWLWLAFVGHAPAGYVHCRMEEVSGSRHFRHLLYAVTAPDMGQSRISVMPQYRRKGVASALLRTSLQHFKTEGVEIATVYAYSDNAPATAFLSNLGFSHQERFYFAGDSDQTPFVFDAVYAELNLRLPLKSVPLNPEVKVRLPREDDLGALIRVFGECSPWVYGTSPPAQQVLAWLKTSPAQLTLVAEYGGETVGAMEFFETGIVGIPGVLPEHRNQGIGTTLFYRLLEKMKRYGHRKAVADTGIMLQDAIKMYHRLGFHIPRRLWAWVKLM